MGDGDDIDSIKEGVNYCCPNGAGCLHQRDYGFDKEVSYLELSQASRIRTRLRWKVLDNEGDIPSNRTTKNSQSQFPSVEWQTNAHSDTIMCGKRVCLSTAQELLGNLVSRTRRATWSKMEWVKRIQEENSTLWSNLEKISRHLDTSNRSWQRW